VGSPALDIEVELERVVDTLAQHQAPYALCGLSAEVVEARIAEVAALNRLCHSGDHPHGAA
jgi:hypothetical protein